MKITSTAFLLFFNVALIAQNNAGYTTAIKTYQKNYTGTHEVVKGKERIYFRFYPAMEKFKISCRFVKSTDTSLVVMKTSGKKIPQKDFIRYGKLIFTINDTTLELTLYQSRIKDALTKDYLFLPFTDLTTGDETYGSGRYIDLQVTDIKKDRVVIDFNKAYNPYCAYSNNYNCPLPPRENYLPVAITAGEKNFAKTVAH